MFIPPSKLQAKLRAEQQSSRSAVRLQASHLLIDQTVAKAVFGTDLNVFIVYYADKRTLMMAPLSDELFKQLHKAKQHMLKARTQLGDKSVALHEILIDHQIDETDRDLEYEYEKGLGILNVKL